jgi:tetratricopeptide (TPR) repeat protein
MFLILPNYHNLFNRAMTLNSGIAKYHNETGTSLFALGKYQEAAAEFEKATQLNTIDPDPPFNLGSTYGTMGEISRQKNDQENAEKLFRLAVINFKKAIELKPDYKSAYQFLGTTYMSLGDTINGQINLDKAAMLKAKK